ncbi:hypothetical protein [Streptomyces klenkii]|uniref:hypothetical protein n=1 Tax=Streptomyces klenkii TaxID=1420899 RepID=UPI003416B9DD
MGRMARDHTKECTLLISYPSLAVALTRVVVDLTWFISSADDERLDPEDALTSLDGIATVLSALSRSQQAELMAIINQMAAEETSAKRREFLVSLPESIGLLEPKV